MTDQDKNIRNLAPWGRASAIALACVLAASALLGPWASRVTGAEHDQTLRLTALDRYYEAASNAVDNENIFEERFKNDASAINRSLHAENAADVESALQNIANVGGGTEQAGVSELLRLQAAYITATERMFDAVVQHKPKRDIDRLDRSTVDRLGGQIANLVQARQADINLAMRRSESTLAKTDRFVQRTALAISLAGLALLVVFLYVLEAYRRRTAELHRAEVARLEAAALTDHLTALGNHRAYQEELGRELSRATRHDEPVSLALIDVDGLKVINDSFGHQRGDGVLAGLAKLLRDLRAEDRAFRIGGDEFAVLLPNTSLEQAHGVMTRLRLAVQGGADGNTVSIGVAASVGADRDPEILRGQADAALYEAKRAGRNAVESYHEDKDGMWLLSAAQIRALRQLIAEGQMGVAFQPIWDVSRCSVLAYEALARPAERFGFRGPQEAFDLAERTGKAHELDELCRRAILEKAGQLPEDALLFINLCPQTLDHPGFDGASFAKLVREAGLTPDRVVVEITERAMNSLDAVVAAAEHLRDYGFRLALDDTGAGNSGLEMLSKLPVEFVKIDRMIVVKAMKDPGARGILAGIVTIARAIGAYVIAEGIEDEQMLRLVCNSDLGEAARCGVNGVQGYLLRRPSETMPERASLDGVRTLLLDVRAERQTHSKPAA